MSLPQKMDNQPKREVTRPVLTVRPYNSADLSQAVAIAAKNFNSHSYSIFPDEIVNAYKRANSPDELSAAMTKPCTESYVVTDSSGDVDAYFILRYHGKEGSQQEGAYGELDLRRTQVDSDKQGMGIASTILRAVEKRAAELGVSTISTQAGGSSRDFFESKGWIGRTILNGMKPIPAVTFACSKDISQNEPLQYDKPEQIIFASTNTRKLNLLRSFVGGDIPIAPIESIEDNSADVVTAARSKALSVEAKLLGSQRESLVIATDVLTDVMSYDDETQKYHLTKKGKPANVEEAIGTFATMSSIAEHTRKSVPYIVRCATVIRQPSNPDQELVSQRDVSVWLTPEALRLLSTPEGFAQYRQDVLAQYGRDIMDNAASFALAYFIKKGVAGMNGYLFDSIPNRDNLIKKANDIVYGAPDAELVRKRLGTTS